MTLTWHLAPSTAPSSPTVSKVTDQYRGPAQVDSRHFDQATNSIDSPLNCSAATTPIDSPMFGGVVRGAVWTGLRVVDVSRGSRPGDIEEKGSD